MTITIEFAPITTIKAATEIAGVLGLPSKMPGKSYGLPAVECKVGGKLRKVPGSTCAKCYALRGNYQYENVLGSQYRRLAAIMHPQWVDAMVYLIERQVERIDPYFRWHDSGDLQSLQHLANIVRIGRQVAWCRFWLPTRESGVVREYLRTVGPFPANLRVRVSAAMVDGVPPKSFPYTSTVHKHNAPHGVECKAYTRGNHCRDCRKCWERYSNISYPVHEDSAPYGAPPADRWPSELEMASYVPPSRAAWAA